MQFDVDMKMAMCCWTHTQIVHTYLNLFLLKIILGIQSSVSIEIAMKQIVNHAEHIKRTFNSESVGVSQQ
jgi:hypothetical protein